MRIAIIGTIGCGKSEVLRVARSMGFATLSADEINRDLLCDPQYVALIEEQFPTAVRQGRADRAELAKIVFNDAAQRAKLNALAHPRILKRIESDASDPLVVEMPLYLESGAARLFDRTVLVTCSDEIRRRRLLLRGMTKEDIDARTRAQQNERLEDVADYILVNDGTLEQLRESAEALFARIL